ncbi:MAG: DNA polymerase III subunit delta' [Candidatus Omnitrophota bacterium]
MSFKDIKGQDKTIAILKEYLRQSRVASAYLFAGPEATGKKLIAGIFAKALNCRENIFDSCDTCPSCLKMDKSGHPDLHFIGGPADNNTDKTDAIKIEDIRQLQKDINLKPYEAKIKVFIIDNAHRLTPEASNALLKILEEPPMHSLIILITHKPALLFKTIISRCQVLKFYPLTRNKLKEILKTDYSLNDNQAHFLAYFSEGRLGYALMLKEKDILKDKNRIIDGFLSHKNIALGNSLEKNRHELRAYLNIMAVWFRDIYLIKAGYPGSEIINSDRENELLASTDKYSFNDLDEIFKSISNTVLYLEENLNIKLLLSNLSCLFKTHSTDKD